jgi:predicted porin
MAAAQMGVDTGNLVAAFGYYDVNRVDEFLDVENLDPDYKYQIIDFYTQYAITMDAITIMPLAHIFYNAGAKGEPGQSVGGENLDPEDTDQNLGWLVGAKAKVDKFSLGVEYGEVGADAAIQDIKDSDWGSSLGSTDIKGWKASAGYKLTKNCQFETTYFYTDPKERKEYKVKDVKRVQVDLKYKF